MYTTNAIESLNNSYKRINKGRRIFPSEQSLEFVLSNRNDNRKMDIKISKLGNNPKGIKNLLWR